MGSRKRIRRAWREKGVAYDTYRTLDAGGRTFKRHRLDVFGRSLPREPAGCRTLEVAAGTGVYSLAVLRRGFSLVATDVSASMLAVLRRKLAEEGFESRCALAREDLFALSFAERSFDFVYCMSLLPRFSDLEDQRTGVLALARVVDRGGRLVFNYHHRAFRAGGFGARGRWTSSQMAEILRTGGMQVVYERGAGLVGLGQWRRLPRAAHSVVSYLEGALEAHPRVFRNVLVVAEKTT